MSTSGGRAPLPMRELAAPLVVIAVLGSGIAATGICTLAAHAAAVRPGVAPSFGTSAWVALIRSVGDGRLDGLIGADGSRSVFWVVLAVLLLPLAALLVGALTWSLAAEARSGSARSAMAGRRELREMRGRAARRRAVQLRPSLAAEPGRGMGPAQRLVSTRWAGDGGIGGIGDRDIGLCLGRRGGQRLFASEEDVVLEIAGPRSNKTSALVVPAILSAPGPVIATSNKVDVYTLTSGLRAEVGRTFVADPQGVVGAPQTWWWNPLSGITDMAEAAQLVAHFSQTVGAGNERADPYFTKGAERLLGQLVLAAALAPPKEDGTPYSLRDVRLWLATRSDAPVQLLTDAGAEDVAKGLQGTLEAPPEQRGGLFETALTAINCLESEPVARLVTPPRTWRTPPSGAVEEFDPWRFLVGYNHDLDGAPVPRDTLYLFTREGAGSAAPVIAALVDHMLRVATRAASAQGGRVDPPLRPVLDEAANICPIRNLPDLYSYFGSMSIQTLTFLQSYQQGVALWGKAGMDKLWSAATIKLVGAGVQDPEFTRWVSDLIGPHEVPTWSHQHGRGGSSSTMSTKDKQIMYAADVAALPKTQAILFSAGRRPALIDLMPWYTEGADDNSADSISAHAAQASAQVRDSAIAALGPRNPVAQVLATRHNDGGGRP